MCVWDDMMMERRHPVDHIHRGFSGPTGSFNAFHPFGGGGLSTPTVTHSSYQQSEELKENNIPRMSVDNNKTICLCQQGRVEYEEPLFHWLLVGN